MSLDTSVQSPQSAHTVAEAPPRGSARIRRGASTARSLLAMGEPWVWLTGGALVLCLAMIVALLVLVVVLGMGTFRTSPLVRLELRDGRVVLGEITKVEHVRLTADGLATEPPAIRTQHIQHFVKSLGSLQALPDRVRQRQERLEQEAAVAQQRVRQTDVQIAELATHRVKADSAYARAAMIRNDAASRRHQELSLQREHWQQRVTSLLDESRTVAAAHRYLLAHDLGTAQAILDAPAAEQAAVLEGLVELAGEFLGEDAITVRRRLLRTGNFELTNEHFQWVADHQVQADGETLPAQAVVVERTSWGRFYGTPLDFRIRVAPEPYEEGREQQRILELLGTHVQNLPDTERESWEKLLAAKRAEYEHRRMDAIQRFLQALRNRQRADESLELVLADGTVRDAESLLPGDVIERADLIVGSPEDAWLRFQQHHGDVRRLVKKIEGLEKDELGETFAMQEAARLRVRQAELAGEVELLESANLWTQRDRERAERATAAAEWDALAVVAIRWFETEPALQELVRQAHAAFRAKLELEMAEADRLRAERENWLSGLSASAQQVLRSYFDTEHAAALATEQIQQEIAHLRQEVDPYYLTMETVDGVRKELPLADIVRAYQANRLDWGGSLRIYGERWWEFVSANPREANSEGGVLPAIWGTIVMTLMMSVAVVPFGVIAALYLREYARSGPVVSIIRIAINNLAGVPSIVFGVFGLGFFCYTVGAFVDGGPANARLTALPTGRWYLVTGGFAVVATVSFLIGLFLLRLPPQHRAGLLQRGAVVVATLGWLTAFCLFLLMLFRCPFFDGFYSANLPNPTWGKGGILWASLTLALMTLPVVIVATEEALAAVPNSMREGSYGCGASKWQTIRRIVLPHALPGIMTGMILAMARGAGEVAPLMLVGAVKLAPDLPLDGHFPFLHGSRSFMHLGFHIFDVGFQSQNSEAAKPMVYTATLLLILIITSLNILAVLLRSALRKRFATGQF